MNYFLLPSLKHAATVRTASLLYNDCEIERIKKERKTISHGWDMVEKKICEKLSHLLPPLLQKAVAKFIRPMDFEVEEWKRNHEFLLEHLGLCCSTWLLWKTDGTINRTLTVKKIIGNDNIDPKIRFVMACTYFLEDEILALWKRIKIVGKRKKNKLVFKDTNLAVKFWIMYLNKKDTKHWSEMIDAYIRIPRYDANPGDIHMRVSCYYLFLSREMRQDYIKYLGRPSVHSDDFQTCVNNMDETDRIEAFKYNFPMGLIKCLTWPYRTVFIKLAEEVFCYLTSEGFQTVLHFMLFGYKHDGEEDFHLFEEFWQMSPDIFKNETKKSERFISLVEDHLREENCPQALKEIVRKCYLD